jgi:hypothetical protein
MNARLATRRYLNATGGLVQTTGVPAGYDPTQLVHAAYGKPPAWLSASDRELWYADRLPDRIRVSAELIATSDVPAYLALLTNGIGTGWDGVTNVPLLTLYSNDLALVRMEQASEQVAAWVHAPAGVGRVDLYGSGDLLFPLGWQLLATLAPGADPRYWSGFELGPAAHAGGRETRGWMGTATAWPMRGSCCCMGPTRRSATPTATGCWTGRRSIATTWTRWTPTRMGTGIRMGPRWRWGRIQRIRATGGWIRTGTGYPTRWKRPRGVPRLHRPTYSRSSSWRDCWALHRSG